MTSTAFIPGNPIPSVYTCTGRNSSPPLAWSDSPAGVQSFALIVDDPDAPGGTWTHWVIYNLPSTEAGLSEGIQPTPGFENGSLGGKNSWGKFGYSGPCPPSGTHRYFFKLYAPDTPLGLASGAGSAQPVKAMQGHILATAERVGTYRKQP